MSKYINAEKLKELIDEKWKELADKGVKVGGGKYEIEIYTYLSVLRLIDSLQQEQPGKSTRKNCNDCSNCIDRKDQIGWHFRGCFGGKYKGKPIAEIEECPLQQEQPGLPGVEESGVPGKDYIPVEWVDACEKYGKWKIVKQEQPGVDLEKEIIRYQREDMDRDTTVGDVARYFYKLGLNARK